MSKKRERPIYAFIKRNGGLFPEMAMDEASIAGLANGERVRVDVSPFRSSDRLRAWWAYLHDCMRACGLDSQWTLEDFSKFVREQVGYCDTHKTPIGHYRVARSVALLSDAKETDIADLFRKTEQFLAETYGYSKEETKHD